MDDNNKAIREQTRLEPDQYSTSHAGLEVAYIGFKKVPPEVYLPLKKVANETGVGLTKALKIWDAAKEQTLESEATRINDQAGDAEKPF